MLILTAAVFLLSHFPVSPAGPNGDDARTTISPSWTVDLRGSIGGVPLGDVWGPRQEYHALPTTSLWFLDNNKIVATFVTREGQPARSEWAGSDANLPLRLCVIFVDAQTGKVTSVEALPSDSREARIVAANGGNFVAQIGMTLTLCSADGKKMRRLRLPVPPGDRRGPLVDASPTGKSVLFYLGGWKLAPPERWIWVDAARLEVIRSWEEEEGGRRIGRIGLSDEAIAMTACNPGQHQCDLEVRGITGGWQKVAAIRWGLDPRFVNDDTLFLSGEPTLSGEPWRLVGTDGKLILAGSDPSEGCTAITSAGGQRFVIPFFKLVGQVLALDIGGYGELRNISVYDAPFRQRSYKLDVKGPKISSVSGKSVADLELSPDGSKLAILFDEKVYLYKLPPAS